MKPQNLDHVQSSGSGEFNSLQEKVLDQVRVERFKQDDKWGQQNHSPETWACILGEEVGEVSKAILEKRFGKAQWRDYREELIQVAAVAVAMVESLHRNELRDEVVK